MPRVLLPEIKVGPPLSRWRAPRAVEVSADEVPELLRQGARLLDEVNEAPPEARVLPSPVMTSEPVQVPVVATAKPKARTAKRGKGKPAGA